MELCSVQAWLLGCLGPRDSESSPVKSRSQKQELLCLGARPRPTHQVELGGSRPQSVRLWKRGSCEGWTPFCRLRSSGLWATEKRQTSSGCRVPGGLTDAEDFLLHRSKTLNIPGERRGYMYFLGVSTYRPQSRDIQWHEHTYQPSLGF